MPAPHPWRFSLVALAIIAIFGTVLIVEEATPTTHVQEDLQAKSEDLTVAGETNVDPFAKLSNLFKASHSKIDAALKQTASQLPDASAKLAAKVKLAAAKQNAADAVAQQANAFTPTPIVHVVTPQPEVVTQAAPTTASTSGNSKLAYMRALRAAEVNTLRSALRYEAHANTLRTHQIKLLKEKLVKARAKLASAKRADTAEVRAIRAEVAKAQKAVAMKRALIDKYASQLKSLEVMRAKLDKLNCNEKEVTKRQAMIIEDMTTVLKEYRKQLAMAHWELAHEQEEPSMAASPELKQLKERLQAAHVALQSIRETNQQEIAELLSLKTAVKEKQSKIALQHTADNKSELSAKVIAAQTKEEGMKKMVQDQINLNAAKKKKISELRTKLSAQSTPSEAAVKEVAAKAASHGEAKVKAHRQELAAKVAAAENKDKAVKKEVAYKVSMHMSAPKQKPPLSPCKQYNSNLKARFLLMQILKKSVRFEPNVATLAKEGKTQLDKAAEVMKKSPHAVLEVDAYSTLGGTKGQQMAAGRAEAAKDYLTSIGVTNQLTSVGHADADFIGIKIKVSGTTAAQRPKGCIVNPKYKSAIIRK
jgi:outer membrane protein OmpA-like peptidoglycan-associated protein